MNESGFRLNRKALFGMMVLAAIGAAPVHAATINVTTVNDVIANDGSCSLREAVIAANNNAVSGAAAGECAAGEPVATAIDTINLPAGTYTLAIAAPAAVAPAVGTTEDWYEPSVADPLFPYVLGTDPIAAVGDLDLTESVNIVGAGMGTTIIDGGDLDRVFQIVADPVTAPVTINVALSSLTARNGFVKWAQITIPADPLVDSYWLFKKLGGGIATGVAAAVTQYVPADHGQGSGGAGDHGQRRGNEGGEEVVGPTYAGLTLTNVGVLNNVSQGDAGGIYNITPMTATGLLVEGNSADANGGGIYNEGNTTITDSTVRGNIAEGGGGLFVTGAQPIKIERSTFSANRAVGGGALSGRSGVTINVVNSTLSGNLARDVGAGFYHNGPASLNFVTIANNISGADAPDAGSGINTFQSGSVDVGVKNVLLAANKKGWTYTLDDDYRNIAIPIPQPDDPAFPFEDANCGLTGGAGNPPITSSGYNLSSDATCTTVLSLATDINNVDPMIGALASNGGPTQTHALLPGSPALSKGGFEASITVDQRGVTRENPPDIGAFELVTAVPPAAGGGGGGGCAIGGEGRLDPTMPAMLAAALAFLGLRRRAGK